jgi:hypothetical protein
MTVGGTKKGVEGIGYRRLATILAVAIAWLGLWTHEFYRMPSALGLTPDGSLPLLIIALGLFIWWLRTADKRAATWALLIYGLINGVGGFLSVLPLSFLPFVPEQTLDHYLVHVWYALCQTPLITVTLAALLTRRV